MAFTVALKEYGDKARVLYIDRERSTMRGLGNMQSLPFETNTIAYNYKVNDTAIFIFSDCQAFFVWQI